MKILVTGASGFIGRALVPRLIKTGHEVVTSSRNAHFHSTEAKLFPITDLGPDTDWRKALVGVETVIHLAARVHVMKDKAKDPLADNKLINTEGTRKLANDAANAGVQHFIFMSTVKVNGERNDFRPFCADDIPAPKESYATPEEAEARARELGGQGFHSHTQEDGGIIYMPFATHAEYESAVGFERDPLDEEFKQTMRDKIRQRMLQLVEASTTNNGF